MSKGYICEKVSAVRIYKSWTDARVTNTPSLPRRFGLARHCRFFRVSAARPHYKKVLDLATHAWLALVPHSGANLILTMVRRACRTQYNYMFIVRSSRCGIKCHKHADISLVCCYECYRNMEARLALWYIGPGVSCQSQVPYFVTFFPVCLFPLFCAIFFTLDILINPSYTTALVLQ